MDKRVIITFVGGAAVGGAVAWWLTKQHYENLIIEVEGSESYIPGNENKTVPGPEEDTEEDKGLTIDYNPPEFKHYKPSSYKDITEAAKKYRSEFWDNPPEFSAEDGWEMGDTDDDGLYPKEEPAERPFVITEEQFSETQLDYDKVTLFYHSGDGTILEESVPYEEFDQKMIEDAIGTDNVEILKKKMEEAEDPEKDVEIYIRNERLGIDYMIIAEPGSFGKDRIGAS